MPEGTLGDEGRRPCTDMVDQRSLTNKAMVLHLLQDRLTSGYLPKQWGHRPHALLMTSEGKRAECPSRCARQYLLTLHYALEDDREPDLPNRQMETTQTPSP